MNININICSTLIALLVSWALPACLVRDKIVGAGAGEAALIFHGDRTSHDEVAFSDGVRVTGWLDADDVRVQGVNLCIPSGDVVSRNVQRIEISGLIEDDLPNVLAGLSPDIAVEPLGADRVGFSPRGVDVASWLAAKRVNPIADRVTFRVQLKSSSDARDGLTWSYVKRILQRPTAIGWPVIDIRSSLLRRTNIGSTIAMSTLFVAAIPVVLLFGALTHAGMGGSSGGSRWSNGSSASSGALLNSGEGQSLISDDADDDLPSTWPAIPCDQFSEALPLQRL